MKLKDKLPLKTDLWRIQLQCAVDACSHARQNDTSISFEALRSSIDEGDDGAGIQNSIFIAQEGYLEKATEDTLVKCKGISDKGNTEIQ